MTALQRVKATGWSLLFVVAGYALAILILLVLGGVLRQAPAPGSLAEAALETGALLLSYGFLTWLIGFRVLKLAPGELGFGSEGHRNHRFHRLRSVFGASGLPGFGWGLVVGFIMGTAAMLIAVPAGHAAWRNDGGTVPQWAGTLLLTSLVLLPAAFAEELAFRGVPLITLGRSFGRAPAIVVLALLFGVAHLDNSSVTLLAVGNIALAGVLLGVAFFTPGRLLTSTGVHFGWNLTLAALAAPVSGTPIPMPWLDYSPGGPGWLTGGAFGPEGGVLASLCILGGILVARLRRQEKMA